jgi:hypothetical protein
MNSSVQGFVTSTAAPAGGGPLGEWGSDAALAGHTGSQYVAIYYTSLLTIGAGKVMDYIA